MQVFARFEPGYAYKRYAYKKRVHMKGEIVLFVHIQDLTVIVMKFEG